MTSEGRARLPCPWKVFLPVLVRSAGQTRRSFACVEAQHSAVGCPEGTACLLSLIGAQHVTSVLPA